MEQRLAGREVADRRDRGQRRVLVPAGPDLFLLERRQPPRHRPVGLHPYPRWVGVDQHADHRPDAGRLIPSPRRGDPEDHVVGARVPGEEEGPGALHEGVEGQPVTAGEGSRGGVRRAIALYRKTGNVRGVLRNLRNLAEIQTESADLANAEVTLRDIDRQLRRHFDARVAAYRDVTRARPENMYQAITEMLIV